MHQKKAQILASAHTHLIPNRIDTFAGMDINLVIGKREGYRIWDMDGHELMDFHLNGGTYNLGHRHPEVLKALHQALEHLDVGNHHFASEARVELAEKLVTSANLQYCLFTPSGSEANDMAIKSARQFTGQRKIVALDFAYHGRSGLSGAAGDASAASYFLSDYPDEFIGVPLNDLDALEKVLKKGEVAAVLMETISAAVGFLVPEDNYLPGVKQLCEQYGALYIADEVQTGLGRTGYLWGVEAWNVQPDMLVTGKGLSGGLYPISALLLSEPVGNWLTENGWGYVSTFGGSEPGCVVGSKVMDLVDTSETLSNAKAMSTYLLNGLQDIQSRLDYLKAVQHKGLIMGVQFDSPNGGISMMKALYDQGLWAIFAGFDPSYIQFKGGLLIDKAYCDKALEKMEAAIHVAKHIKDDGKARGIGK